MSQTMWFSAGGERVRETVEAAFDWCEQCWVVSDAPTSDAAGDAFWSLVESHAAQIGGAIFSNLGAADGKLTRAVHASGRLRRFTEGSGPQSHFAWFERGDTLRFVLAPAALRASTVGGPGLWLFWEGLAVELPEGLQAFLDGCRSSSIVVGPDDLPGAAPARATFEPYSRPIPSVREVLGIRGTRDFFELEAEDQERAVWSTLIGEGPVDLEQAIRQCAERLRAQGFLDYQALRQEGRVYKAIEERLLAARRRTDLFDRPRNGFVRAIQANLDELRAEQWRDCLMGALDVGARVDRDQAVRLGFEYAQAIYGVDAQRLRSGGRADQALRSAINSSLRQEYLSRDGAAYLVRVSALAPPTLRGTVTAEPASSPDTREREVTEPLGAALVDPASVDAPAATEAPASAPPTAEAPVDSPTAETALAVPTASDSSTAPAASTSAPHSATPSAEPTSPFDGSLHALEFPTRTLNWADRQEVSTIRELAAWQPTAFAVEKNIGRRTVRETRELLEAHLGCSWEDAYATVHGKIPDAIKSPRADGEEEVDSATEALTAGGSTGWARLASNMTEEQRATSLLDIPLPTRMRNFVRAERMERLGDLFRLSHPTLAAKANLGRKSLNDTMDVVRDFLSESASQPAYATFLQAWQAQLSALEAIPRMIVTRRAGMHGTRETLEELGGMLGVTRERVRQIELGELKRLRERSRWRRSVEEKLKVAFGAARALPLDLLGEDPWWAGIDRQELLLDFVVRRIFEDELFLLAAPSGKRFLTRFPPEQFAEHLESAKARVAKLEFPIERAAIDQILSSEAEPLDPVLFSEFDLALGELLHADPEKPGMVLGYGRYRYDEVLAFLSGQDQPVPIALVEERCGRGAFPDEVLYFKRGVVGLKRHFPDFYVWMERLVPAALEVMKERPAGRQWLVPELHDALRERDLLPEWLGHWHLASLLRVSGQVHYLGRLRVSSKDSQHEQRLQYEELLEHLLEQAGTPLDFAQLIAQARLQTDIGDAAALMVRQAPFVRLDEHRIGLVQRDIPGGPAAVATAIEAVVHTLTDTQQGLTPHQATLIVNKLSDVHASWSRQLVTSVLRNETTIRIDRSKNIGLDEWDDARCPTRPEFVRRVVQAAAGGMSVQDLYSRMEAFYGRAPDRGSLGVMAEQVGLKISGDQIARPGSALPQTPPASRGAINLSGIPTELREMFEEMIRGPLTELPSLRAEIKQHLGAIEQEHHVNEFVDLPGAHVLARQCNLLLDRWGSLPISDQHIVHAAVRYFVSWDDLENDFDIGGLDDDKQVMNAVLSHLGIQEELDGALAN